MLQTKNLDLSACAASLKAPGSNGIYAAHIINAKGSITEILRGIFRESLLL